jgi:hypothetical protein
MRLKITYSGFALFIKEASFIFHPVLHEKLESNFIDLYNSWNSTNLDEIFQKDIKLYNMHFQRGRKRERFTAVTALLSDISSVFSVYKI